MMSGQSMADVLAGHDEIAWDQVGGIAVCGGCDESLGDLRADMITQDGWLRTHQAAALSAAGFGPVQEAQYSAWAKGLEFGMWTDIDMASDPYAAHEKNPYRKEQHDHQ